MDLQNSPDVLLLFVYLVYTARIISMAQQTVH